MWFSVWIDPLWDGLNPSSSLVLEAASGQLDPLSSILLLLALLSSLVLCLLSLVLPLSLCLLSLVHGFKAI